MAHVTGPEHDAVLAVLSRHVGRGHGIAAHALAGEAAISPRRVRYVVTALRVEGVAVCGHPKTGYYLAQTPAEVEETCQFLRARALHSLHLEAQLRRMTLPDLVGQMRFNQ